MKDSTMYMYNNMVYGVKVSDYGLEHGRLDYTALAEIIGSSILNNTVRDMTMCDWEIVNGEFDTQVMSDYIISDYGFRFLKEHTNELVFYNETLDIYIWAIDHYGTNWSYVLTEIRLSEVENNER